jgi:AraC family transcriptional regulator
MQSRLASFPTTRQEPPLQVVAHCLENVHWDEPHTDRGGILASLVADAFGNLDTDIESARSALHRALALLDSTRAPAKPDAAAARCALAPWQARRIVTHIQGNLETNICVSELATHVKLSTSYFSRAFKGSFGQAPHSYILARKVDRAKHEMLTTAAALCHIALACGFSDQAHFSRVFRRLVGQTPKAWRRTRHAGATTRPAGPLADQAASAG